MKVLAICGSAAMSRRTRAEDTVAPCRAIGGRAAGPDLIEPAQATASA
jgi:hypothetical protein